jgi:probable rRNA maturation factor
VTVLEAEVVKAVRAGVAPAFVRRVLVRAAKVPEIAARLPDGVCTVAVRITGDDEMERLNRTYAGDAHATDVLSFAGAGSHVGDIAVSWPAVVRQAAEYGHDEKTELALLAVHGVLHLLGWDHAKAAERREMNRLTLAALERSGIKLAPNRL